MIAPAYPFAQTPATAASFTKSLKSLGSRPSARRTPPSARLPRRSATAVRSPSARTSSGSGASALSNIGFAPFHRSEVRGGFGREKDGNPVGSIPRIPHAACRALFRRLSVHPPIRNRDRRASAPCTRPRLQAPSCPRRSEGIWDVWPIGVRFETERTSPPSTATASRSIATNTGCPHRSS